MPALHRTIVPRLRKSLQAHGVWGTLRLSVAAPVRLVREYRTARRFYRQAAPDTFDLTHQIETSQRVHQSDLATDSPNWIYGVGYWPTPVGLIREILEFLPIRHEEFTFIDLGSGKGRVLLLASEYAFEKIIGVEYAPELHLAAFENIRGYRNGVQKCKAIESVCRDMAKFQFPEKPLAIFLYNPTSEPVMRVVAENLRKSLDDCPRTIWIVYVTPAYDIFESGVFDPESLQQVKVTDKYKIYRNAV
jgi:SAM-dependent methyltransferase